jgi:hypothetical protein
MRTSLLLSLLTIWGSAFAQCGAGEVEVEIAVSTDGYGYETYWELLPNGSACGNGTLFAGGNPAVGCNGAGLQAQLPGGYGNNLVITEGPWCLTAGGSYAIFWADDWGDGGVSFDVIVDGVSSAQFVGVGGSPAETFTFLAQQPVDHDLELTLLNTPLYVFEGGDLFITGDMKNAGMLTVNSCELSYTVDGGAPVVAALNGLNLAPGLTLAFEHPVPWASVGVGMHVISVQSLTVNGNPDGNTINDVATMDTKVQAPVPNIIDQYLQAAPTVNVIADSDQDLLVPRDLDFHPDMDRNELWVINKDVESSGGSTVTFFGPGAADMEWMWKRDPNAWHFMSLPSGIAMGDNGFFSTSPGIFDANQNGGDPFTGPTLWSADTSIYAATIYGPLGSHFDMLHVTPNSQGIAHDRWNRYWVVDGFNGDVVMHDFAGDHGPGNSYHGNAIIRRYADFTITKDPNDHIVSHTVLDKATGWLYVVDHGGQRVLRLDTRTGSVSGPGTYGPWESYVEYSMVSGYDWDVVASTGLVEPAGIEVMGDRLLVSDHANGDIVIYDISVDPVVELGRILTGSAGIMGIRVGPDGRIWAVNATTHQLLRVDPAAITGVPELQVLTPRAYPNPAQDQLQFDGMELANGSVLEVVDMAGRVVARPTYRGAGRSIDVSMLHPGPYLLRASGGSQHLRFVIQR